MNFTCNSTIVYYRKLCWPINMQHWSRYILVECVFFVFHLKFKSKRSTWNWAIFSLNPKCNKPKVQFTQNKNNKTINIPKKIMQKWSSTICWFLLVQQISYIQNRWLSEKLHWLSNRFCLVFVVFLKQHWLTQIICYYRKLTRFAFFSSSLTRLNLWTLSRVCRQVTK